jgi:hypothetical protein
VASAAVCFDAAVARIVLAAGVPVVLCGPDGDALSRGQGSLRSIGRVALLVGDPGEDAVVSAALAMAGELFGKDAVPVGSVVDAGQVARSDSHSAPGSGSVERPR